MNKQINANLLFVAMVIGIVLMLSFNANAQTSSCGEADYDCQIKIASKAIQANPQDSESYYARANAYLNKGDDESAIRDYSKTLELNEGKYEVYDHRAAAYYNLKRYAAAIADYTKSIELDPTYTENYINRANAYDDAGNFNAAIKDYNEAVKLENGNASAYFNRGVASLNHGSLKQAISDFQKVLQLQPENARAKELLGKAQSAKTEKDAQTKAKLAKFGQALDQIVSNGQNQTTQQSSEQTGATANSRNGNNSSIIPVEATQRNLLSTGWALMSLTKKGEQVKEQQNPPDVDFCKDGSWTMLHYGNVMQGGKYQLSGSHLVMKLDDNSIYADAEISLAGNVLTLDDGDYVYKLKYIGKVDC